MKLVNVFALEAKFYGFESRQCYNNITHNQYLINIDFFYLWVYTYLMVNIKDYVPKFIQEQRRLKVEALESPVEDVPEEISPCCDAPIINGKCFDCKENI